MKLVEIEDRYFNPDNVVIVRKAGSNAQGFVTEVLLTNGQQLLYTPVEEVARWLSVDGLPEMHSTNATASGD